MENSHKPNSLNNKSNVDELNSALSLAIEACSMGSWVWDFSDNCVHYSPEKMKIFGFKESKGSLDDFTKNVHPDDIGRVWEEVQLCIKEKRVWRTEFRYFKHGKMIWIEESGKATYDADGTPVKMTGITKDITTARLKEIDLIKSENNLAESQSLANLGSWELDLKTGKQTWSKQLYKIFDYEETVTPHWSLILNRTHPEDEVSVKIESNRLIQLGIVKALTINPEYKECHRILLPVGLTKWIETRLKLTRDKDGTPIAVYGAVLDVTGRKFREKKIADQQKLINHSSKFSALGEMAGGIAHEINNPLMIIMTTVELLQSKLEEVNINQEFYKQDIETIQGTTERIAKIVKGLKIFSRDEDKDPFQSVEVKEIINNALCISNQRMMSNQIKLFLGDITTDLKISCRGTQISQVLLNLLNNSFDAISNLDNKWIKVEVEKTEKNKIRISVTDSGLGIKKDVADKIMEPFFTTKEIGKGTGLGLSISKGIIESHNGRLIFDNSCSNTKFIIELPHEA